MLCVLYRENETALPHSQALPRCEGRACDEGEPVNEATTYITDAQNGMANNGERFSEHIQALVMAKPVYKNSLEGICMNFVKVLLVYNM